MAALAGHSAGQGDDGMGVASRVVSLLAGVCLESAKLWGNRKAPCWNSTPVTP